MSRKKPGVPISIGGELPPPRINFDALPGPTLDDLANGPASQIFGITAIKNLWPEIPNPTDLQ